MTGSKVRRFLVVRHIETGEEAERFDVTGKSEQHIEKLERGLLLRVSDDWYVDDVQEGDGDE